MAIFETFLLVVHVRVAVAICGFVLLQHGKGADMGAAFGSGSAGSVFGAAGSANFLSRTTAVLATVFFVTSLALTWYGATRSVPKDVMQQGVMGKVPVPSKAADVPTTTPVGSAPAADPAKAPAAGGAAGGTRSGDVPK
jgi:preprotein translocase subunit SecG